MKHSPAPTSAEKIRKAIKSDAALIAAAPEMYEVMKGLEALGSDIAPYWAERIKSAIAKAEGK